MTWLDRLRAAILALINWLNTDPSTPSPESIELERLRFIMSHLRDEISDYATKAIADAAVDKQLADLNAAKSKSAADLGTAKSVLSDALKSLGAPRFDGPLADGSINEYSYDATQLVVVRSILSVDTPDPTPAPEPVPTPAPEPTPVI